MTTSARTDYESFLLREVKDLPESELRKVLKMIRFLKEEILQTESEEGKDLRMFWESVVLKPAEASFRQGWQEAQLGQTKPVSELWKDIEAE